jgi:hypothetical protein
MSIFSSIAKTVTSVAKAVVKAVVPTQAKIANVGAVLGIATGIKSGTIYATTPSASVNKALETVANHPYVTAGVIAVAAAPAAAVAAAKVVGATVVKAVSSASPAVKIATVVGTPVAAGVLISSSKAREGVLDAPSALVQVGTNVGKLIENPSWEGLVDIYKQNPVAAPAVTAAAVGLIGAAAAGAALTIGNITATKANTKSINEATNELMKQAVAAGDIKSARELQDALYKLNFPQEAAKVPAVIPTKTSAASSVPITPELGAVTKAAGTKAATKYKRRTTASTGNQSMRVNIFNQTKAIYSRGSFGRHYGY